MFAALFSTDKRKTKTMARDEMNEMKGNVAEIINLFCERGPQIILDLTDPKIERKLGEINSRFRSWCIDFGLYRPANACGDLMVQKDIREAQTARRLTQHLKDDLGNCVSASRRQWHSSN